MLSEKNKPDTQRQILYESTFWMYLCQMEAESSIVVARGWGQKGVASCPLMSTVSSWEDEVQEIEAGDDCATV